MGKKRKKGFPALAENLHLEFLEPVTCSGLGSLVGAYKGYSVSVRPDDQAKIEVKVEREKFLHLSSTVRNKFHANKDMISFDFDNKEINRFLISRFAKSSKIEVLSLSPILLKQLNIFRVKWAKVIVSIRFGGNSISVHLKYGNMNYIPISKITTMLDDLVTLTKILEVL